MSLAVSRRRQRPPRNVGDGMRRRRHTLTPSHAFNRQHVHHDRVKPPASLQPSGGRLPSWNETINWNREYNAGRNIPLHYAPKIDYRDYNEVGDCKYAWEPSRLPT